MARLSRAEQRGETRRRLIEAAAKVFAQQGFEAAPIDVIAETAGFSRGAFYSNFESKDEVFLILLNDHLETEIVTLSAAVARIDRAEDIPRAIERRYRVLGEDSSWCLLMTEFQLYATRGGRMAEEFARIFERYRTRLGAIIAEQGERLGFTLRMAAYDLGAAQIALAHGLALQRATDGRIAPAMTSQAMALLFDGAIERR